jgi:hypothetical protein
MAASLSLCDALHLVGHALLVLGELLQQQRLHLLRELLLHLLRRRRLRGHLPHTSSLRLCVLLY